MLQKGVTELICHNKEAREAPQPWDWRRGIGVKPSICVKPLGNHSTPCSDLELAARLC